MSNSNISLERETHTVSLIIDALKSAYGPLVEKKEQLEVQVRTEEIDEILGVINLRLDTLIKVENNLLKLIHDEYSFIERAAGDFAPSDIAKIIEERNNKYIKSIMQGL